MNVNIYFLDIKMCICVLTSPVHCVYSSKTKSENAAKLKLLDESFMVSNQFFYPNYDFLCLFDEVLGFN